MTYVAAEDRYEKKMPYRRCGRSGIELPEVSLGLWQNFGDDRTIDTQRAILRRAFDLGVTHFDLADRSVSWRSVMLYILRVKTE